MVVIGTLCQRVGFLEANGDIHLGKIDSGSGTKPLPEQMLTCLVFTWKQFHNECPSHYSVNEFEVELLKSKPRLPRANELTCLKSMQDPKWISRLDWSSCDNSMWKPCIMYVLLKNTDSGYALLTLGWYLWKYKKMNIKTMCWTENRHLIIFKTSWDIYVLIMTLKKINL